MLRNKNNVIIVFEHNSIYCRKGELTPKELTSLQQFYKEDNFPYYKLVHNGVKFCEYVGVIQIGNLIIEILPKADNRNEAIWKTFLFDMLKVTGYVDVEAPTVSNLNLKSNSLLDLYFEMFVNETEILFHKGLIKKYAITEQNRSSLKGNLMFAKQLQYNIVHKERFYTSATVYNCENKYNSILYKALKLLNTLCYNSTLKGRIGLLLLSFPELKDINVTDATFSKIVYNRKTENYKKAIDIAKLLLLNYHPDVTRGKNNVLSIMFDMNALWEKFIYITLRNKANSHYTVTQQTRKLFWQKEGGFAKKMIPDIVIKNGDNVIVLDTKWKNIGYLNPSDADLRQMYTYSKFHKNAPAALVYPSQQLESEYHKGSFFNEETNELSKDHHCGIIKLSVADTVSKWQNHIHEFICRKLNILPVPK